jgi:hypothetical protein
VFIPSMPDIEAIALRGRENQSHPKQPSFRRTPESSAFL